MERENPGSWDAGDQCRELSAGVRAWRGVLMTSGRGATAAHGPHPPIWLVSKIVLSGRRCVMPGGEATSSDRIGSEKCASDKAADAIMLLFERH